MWRRCWIHFYQQRQWHESMGNMRFLLSQSITYIPTASGHSMGECENYLESVGGWEGWPSNAAKSLANWVRNSCSLKFCPSSKANKELLKEHKRLRKLKTHKMKHPSSTDMAKVTSVLKEQNDKFSGIPLTHYSPWIMSRLGRGKITSLWAEHND